MELYYNLLLTPLILLILVLVLKWFADKKTEKLSGRSKTSWIMIHVFFAILYFSGMLGILLLTLSTKFTQNAEIIYTAHLFIQYFNWFMTIPGGLFCLLSGIWLAARSNWGLTRYYWVLAKIGGNILAITFGATFMRIWIHENIPVIISANVHPLKNPAYLNNHQMLLIGLVVSFAILFFLFVISYLKPWGRR